MLFGRVARHHDVAERERNASSVETTMMFATACLFLFAGIGYFVGRVADSIVLEAVKTNFDRELQARETAAADAR